MVFIGIIFPVLAGIFMIFVLIYTRKANKPKSKKSSNGEQHEKSDYEQRLDKNQLKKLINIKHIKNNKIYMRNGSVRVNLSISSPDFELLTDSEQTSFENCLIMSALSLNFPIMFHTTLKKMDVREPAEQVERTMNSGDTLISDNLKNYCSQLYTAYRKMEDEKGVFVRKSFCTIGAYLPNKDEKKVLNELQSRVDNVAGGLARARMKVNLLSSESTAQIFADLFNRGKNIKIQNLEKEGVFDLYSEGVGQVVKISKEKE